MELLNRIRLATLQDLLFVRTTVYTFILSVRLATCFRGWWISSGGISSTYVFWLYIGFWIWGRLVDRVLKDRFFSACIWDVRNNPRCLNYHLNRPKLGMGWRNLRPRDLLYILYINVRYSLQRVYDIRSTLFLQTATIIEAQVQWRDPTIAR